MIHVWHKKVKRVLKGRNAMLNTLIGWERGYEVDCKLFRISCLRSVSLYKSLKSIFTQGVTFLSGPTIEQRGVSGKQSCADRQAVGWCVTVLFRRAVRKLQLRSAKRWLVDMVLRWPLGPGQSQKWKQRGLDRKEQEHVTQCVYCLCSLTF